MKLLPILAISVIMLSCSGGGSQNESSNTEETEGEEVYEEVDGDIPEDMALNIDFDDMLKRIPNANFPDVWDMDRLDQVEGDEKISATTDQLFTTGWFPERISSEDPVEFHWKHVTPNYTIVMFETFEMYARGGSSEYFVGTLKKDEEGGFRRISIENFAANRTISVSNPNGGTSAGQEFLYGYFNKPNQFSTVYYDDSLAYFIQDDGKIQLDLLATYANNYGKPLFMEGTLTDVVNNIDYTSFSFETSDGEKEFSSVSGDLTGPDNPFYELVDDPDGGVIATFQVKESAKKPYAIRYEIGFGETMAGEYEEYELLTGLEEIGTPISDFTPRDRSFTGKIVRTNKTNANVMQILMQEEYSEQKYVFFIQSGASMISDFNQKFNNGDKVELNWKWANGAAIDLKQDMFRMVISFEQSQY